MVRDRMPNDELKTRGSFKAILRWKVWWSPSACCSMSCPSQVDTLAEHFTEHGAHVAPPQALPGGGGERST